MERKLGYAVDGMGVGLGFVQTRLSGVIRFFKLFNA